MEGEDICTIVKVCAFISLTATSRMQLQREGGIPATASDHSCPGHRGAATVVCPEAERGEEGKQQTTLFAGTWHDAGSSPLAQSLAAQVTELHANPRGAGQTFLKLC